MALSFKLNWDQWLIPLLMILSFIAGSAWTIATFTWLRGYLGA